MNKTLLIASGFVFGLCGFSLSAGAQILSAPVVFCELAALPPAEALERLAESYQGLLGFGGEAMAREYTTLESFFELVPNGDQRSVALNESLTKLGDWVMLEAQDLGLTHEVILARLQEVVQTHAQGATQERERTQERREERREVRPMIRSIALSGAHQANWVLGGRYLLINAAGKVSLWDAQTLRQVQAFQTFRFPELVFSPDGSRAAIQSYNDPKGDKKVIQVWDSQDPYSLRDLKLSKKVAELKFSEKNQLFFRDSTMLYFEEVNFITGRKTREVRDFFRERFTQSGEFLARLVEDDSTHLIRFRRPSLRATAPVPEDLVFDGPVAIEALTFQFGMDDSQFFFMQDGTDSLPPSLIAYRREGALLRSSWSAELQNADGAFDVSAPLRRAAGEIIIAGVSQQVHVLSAQDGQVLHRFENPMDKPIHRLSLSPSERLLAVVYDDLKTIEIIDLETRKKLKEVVLSSGALKVGLHWSPDETELLLLQKKTVHLLNLRPDV